MKNVIIHRCPTCGTIRSKTDQLVAELEGEPELEVRVVDGASGEFRVEVDGRRIRGETPAELAAAAR